MGRTFTLATFVEISVLIFSVKIFNLQNHTYLLTIIFTMSVSFYFCLSFITEVYQLYVCKYLMEFCWLLQWVLAWFWLRCNDQ